MPATYKHYSFDLWLTLIKSNPSFKKERTAYFFQHYNRSQKSIEEVSAIFRQVDLMCNSINEKTGRNLDAEELYLMVIGLVNDFNFPIQDVDVTALYAAMDELVFDYMPVLYSTETVEVLDRICQRGDASVSLLSNTGFIKGITLRKVLRELELDRYLNFQLYSDETGFSKPAPDFFALMLTELSRIRPDERVALHEIIHVGDNPLADERGARNVGIQSLLINSNQISISSLLN